MNYVDQSPAGPISSRPAPSRPPLVLLHGFPLDGRMWREQIDALRSTTRVIVPDFRGFGQSSAGTDPLTVASMAADVHDLLEAAGALPCVIAGLSMGGYVAMHFAARYSEALRGIALVDTRDSADNPEQKANRDRMIAIAHSKGSRAIAELMMGKLLSPDTPEHRPQVVAALREQMEACPPQTIALALAAMRDRPDMTEVVSQIAVPALVLVGDADAITPVSVAEQIQSRIKGAELTIIRGAGHMTPMEQPLQVNRALRGFVERI